MSRSTDDSTNWSVRATVAAIWIKFSLLKSGRDVGLQKLVLFTQNVAEIIVKRQLEASLREEGLARAEGEGGGGARGECVKSQAEASSFYDDKFWIVNLKFDNHPMQFEIAIIRRTWRIFWAISDKKQRPYKQTELLWNQTGAVFSSQICFWNSWRCFQIRCVIWGVKFSHKFEHCNE